MRLILFLFVCLPFCPGAQLRVAPIFTDNMVLQRNEPITVWGKALPGQGVTVTFGGATAGTTPGSDSVWRVRLGRQKANSRPQTMVLSTGTETLELKNLLVGDLWVCTGQSNMEFPMSREGHFKEEAGQATLPLLRFYNPTYAGKNIFNALFTDSVRRRLTVEDFYQGRWQVCDSTSMRTMSAVGYYFGRKLMTEEGVPVGLIHLSIGGAPLETFISREALLGSERFAPKARGNWLINEDLPVWIRERGVQNLGPQVASPANEPGPAHAYQPGFAFAAGIAPILSLPVKGILFYQGESNAQEKERVAEYGDLMALMVADYRRQWKSPRLPFYYVQLSSIDTVQYKGQLWFSFREEQRQALAKIPYSGMAVSSDIGARNDVHPTNKKPVGERLARWALYQSYGRKVLPSGPLPRKAVHRNGKVLIYFDYTGKNLRPARGKVLVGFSLDGKTTAVARARRHRVRINSPGKPSFVYYGWEPFTRANLVNSEGLPASTFKLKVQ